MRPPRPAAVSSLGRRRAVSRCRVSGRPLVGYRRRGSARRRRRWVPLGRRRATSEGHSPPGAAVCQPLEPGRRRRRGGGQSLMTVSHARRRACRAIAPRRPSPSRLPPLGGRVCGRPPAGVGRGSGPARSASGLVWACYRCHRRSGTLLSRAAVQNVTALPGPPARPPAVWTRVSQRTTGVHARCSQINLCAPRTDTLVRLPS